MPEISKEERAALDRINSLEDPERLRTLIKNARERKSKVVEKAAFARLCEVQPSAKSGTLEYDVWRSIFALEEMLRIERGKTVLLSRTRQKIARDGEAKTVADLTLKKEPSEGFQMLVDLEHPELLFEAVVLRHPEIFDRTTQDAARSRLDAAGVDLEAVAQVWKED